MIQPPSNNSLPSMHFILPKCIPNFRSDTVGGVHPTILTTIYAVTMVAVVVFNLLLVVGISNTRKNNKLTNSNKLFLFLCLSDLLTGSVVLPLQIYYIHLVPNVTCVQVGILEFWSSFPLILSGTHIVVITLDRYLMMVKNHFYRKWFSGKYLLVNMVLLEICISLGWALWYVFSTQTLDMNVSAAMLIGICLYQILLLTSVTILNLKMVSEVKLSRKNTTLTNNNIRVEKVLSKTVAMISIALVICYTSSTIATGVAGFYALYSKNRIHLNRVTTILIYCLVPMQINSALNAVIYLVRNSRIRGFYKRLCVGGKNSISEGHHISDSLDSQPGTFSYSKKMEKQTYAMTPHGHNTANNTSQDSSHKNSETVDIVETVL